jgi:hypothetical protein
MRCGEREAKLIEKESSTAATLHSTKDVNTFSVQGSRGSKAQAEEPNAVHLNQADALMLILKCAPRVLSSRRLNLQSSPAIN